MRNLFYRKANLWRVSKIIQNIEKNKIDDIKINEFFTQILKENLIGENDLQFYKYNIKKNEENLKGNSEFSFLDKENYKSPEKINYSNEKISPNFGKNISLSKLNISPVLLEISKKKINFDEFSFAN